MAYGKPWNLSSLKTHSTITKQKKRKIHVFVTYPVCVSPQYTVAKTSMVCKTNACEPDTVTFSVACTNIRNSIFGDKTRMYNIRV